MKAYLVVDITVHDPEAFQKYAEKAPEFIEKHQGRYLVRGAECKCVEGDWQPNRLIVLEFPSKQYAAAFLADPDYQAVAALRHTAAHSNLVMVDGYQ